MNTVEHEMEVRRRQIVKELRPRAVPGNRTWQRIVALTDYDGDYSPADHGEAPQGTRWVASKY